MEQKDYERLVEYAITMARNMMECGAEAWRAEKAIRRTFEVYGVKKMDIHVMATLALATIRTEEGYRYTSSRAISPAMTKTNLMRLEEINAAAREVCEKRPPTEELHGYLEKRWPKQPPVFNLLGNALGAGAFAVFFGGTAADGITAALIALVVFAIDQIQYFRKQNHIISVLCACFICAVVARGIVGVVPGLHLDMVLIGVVMIFVPGLALVNGVREMFYSDYITGSCRMVEAVLTAGAIAVGFALALMLGGGVPV